MRFILINGAGQKPAAWDGVLAALPPRLRDIAETIPLTPSGDDDDYSFGALRARVDEAIGASADGQVVGASAESFAGGATGEGEGIVLVGQSAGADLALAFAARHPELVRILVLADAHASTPAWAARISRASYRAIPGRAVRSFSGLSREQKLQLSRTTPTIEDADLSGIRADVTIIGGANDLVERAAARRLRGAMSDAPGSARIVGVYHTIRDFNERHPRVFAGIIEAAVAAEYE